MTAAAVLFHEHGVAGTSLDDIRAATATSTSQLYHSFTDTSVLVRAGIERPVAQVLQAQRPQLDGLDPMVGLRRWRDRVLAPLNAEDGCPLGRLSSELVDGFASRQDVWPRD